jgi:transketolase
MGAISGVDLPLSGSHAGVEIGADGPSQMALEDLAMMRAVHGSTVLYPSDGTSTAALVLIGAGITLHEALRAADILSQEASPRGLSTVTPSSRSTPRR